MTTTLAEELAPTVTPDQMVLPETWSGPIARSVLTGDGRDFSATVWSWRDPEESRMPLMWQTETNMGHFAARLAGYMTELSLVDGTPTASGVFLDNEEGRAFRDTLAVAGRWGVSVDPGMVEAEEVCTDVDEEGGCIAAVTTFLAYEIIGVTGTPFPAFPDAYIELDGATDDREPAPVVEIVASSRVTPPAKWFNDPRLKEPTAMTITDDGHVFGHVCTFDQPHLAWGNVAVYAPDKVAARLFHTGKVHTAEGRVVATGPLVMGCDHAAVDPALGAKGAIDHYAHTGLAWADVKLGVDDFGIWCAGRVRPEVSPAQVSVLRASALSGDWRMVKGELQLVGVLTVNGPGFPVPAALAASGAPLPHEGAMMRARMIDGEVVALTGMSVVLCPECRKRALIASMGADEPVEDTRLDEVVGLLRSIEIRTRTLAEQRREHLAARIQRV